MGFQKLNKKGLSITSTFYAIIVVGIFLTGFGLLIATTGSYYNPSLNYDLGSLNKNDNVTSTVSTYQDRLNPETVDPNSDFESTTYTGSFGIVNTLFSAFGVVFGASGMLTAVGNKFGVPPFIIQGIGLMMLIGVTFAIVGIIFRLGRQP